MVPSHLREESSYRHWVTVTIRYSDQDPVGHVNNAVYVTWIEACRVSYIAPFLPEVGDLDFVLANMQVDFLKETRFPGEVQVGGRIERLGNTSIHTAWGVFQDTNCLAVARCVNVFFDTRIRRPTPPPPDARERLLAEIPGP